MKRLIFVLLKSKNKILTIGYLLLNWKTAIEWFHYSLSEIYMDCDRYCQPVRELYRVIKNEKIRDIICAVLEYDTAYRYRIQDIILEINKIEFEKNPIKEIKRLFNILYQRDFDSMKKKWKVIGSWIWIVKFLPKFIKELKKIIREINLDEIKLSKEDIYWTNKQPEYNYRGIDKETRLKEYEREKFT